MVDDTGHVETRENIFTQATYKSPERPEPRGGGGWGVFPRKRAPTKARTKPAQALGVSPRKKAPTKARAQRAPGGLGGFQERRVWGVPPGKQVDLTNYNDKLREKHESVSSSHEKASQTKAVQDGGSSTCSGLHMAELNVNLMPHLDPVGSASSNIGKKLPMSRMRNGMLEDPRCVSCQGSTRAIVTYELSTTTTYGLMQD
jgi:hypothetical protein